MAGTDPISAVSGATQAAGSSGADSSSQDDNTKLQDAFQEGVVKLMGIILQSTQSDIIQSIQDNTSDPDAPS